MFQAARLPGPFFFFSVLSSHPHGSVIDGDTLSTTVVTTQKLTQTFSGELAKWPCDPLLTLELEHHNFESVAMLKLATGSFF